MRQERRIMRICRKDNDYYRLDKVASSWEYFQQINGSWEEAVPRELSLLPMEDKSNADGRGMANFSCEVLNWWS